MDSVGPRVWLEELAASYRDFVDGFVGAEDAGVYRPHPGIYRDEACPGGHGAPGGAAGVVQPLRYRRAGATGMRTAWCKRQPDALFDPWGPRPDYVIS